MTIRFTHQYTVTFTVKGPMGLVVDNTRKPLQLKLNWELREGEEVLMADGVFRVGRIRHSLVPHVEGQVVDWHVASVLFLKLGGDDVRSQSY